MGLEDRALNGRGRSVGQPDPESGSSFRRTQRAPGGDASSSGPLEAPSSVAARSRGPRIRPFETTRASSLPACISSPLRFRAPAVTPAAGKLAASTSPVSCPMDSVSASGRGRRDSSVDDRLAATGGTTVLPHSTSRVSSVLSPSHITPAMCESTISTSQPECGSVGTEIAAAVLSMTRQSETASDAPSVRTIARRLCCSVHARTDTSERRT